MTRKDAAEAAFVDYDFEPYRVLDTNRWNEDGDEWTMLVFLEDDEGQDQRCGFVVRFEPGTTTVIDAHMGDLHTH